MYMLINILNIIYIYIYTPVVAREAVDAALHQDEAELGVVVLFKSIGLLKTN